MIQRLTSLKLIVSIVLTISSVYPAFGAPNISCPVNVSFTFSDQRSLDETFSDYLHAFIVTENGCAITSSTDLSTFSPPRFTGGTVTIVFEATDCNGTDRCTATFTAINNCGAPPVIPICPDNMTLVNCSSDEEAMASFSLWLEGFTFTGGCDVTTTDLSTFVPPGCGGTTEILYVVMSQSDTIACSATFAIPAEVAAPDPSTTVPTMGEWSIICSFLLFMIVGILELKRQSIVTTT